MQQELTEKQATIKELQLVRIHGTLILCKFYLANCCAILQAKLDCETKITRLQNEVKERNDTLAAKQEKMQTVWHCVCKHFSPDCKNLCVPLYMYYRQNVIRRDKYLTYSKNCRKINKRFGNCNQYVHMLQKFSC